jgi:hypothetical protein
MRMIQSQGCKVTIGDKPDEPYLYGKSLMQPLKLMQLTANSDPDFQRPRFKTIDDMLDLARELVDGLNKLGEQKFPLDVRRGVRKMEREKNSEMLKSASKTYFFDIKETRDKKPFLIITESRLMGDGQKPERTSIMIFQENVHEFANIVNSMAERIAKSNQ